MLQQETSEEAVQEEVYQQPEVEETETEYYDEDEDTEERSWRRLQ
jgi:hypothetical protein